MWRQRGYALLLLVFATLLIFLLGSSLLFIALSDLRVSRHLAEADRAFYYAEAGIELLQASLPRRHSELRGYRLQAERLDSPRFSGSVTPLPGENYAFQLTAMGQAGVKRREAAAEARYFPFGGSAVFAGSFQASGATVLGSVYADRILVGAGETVISGDLAVKEIRLEEGGNYFCMGREWQREGPDLAWPDLACLAAKAKAEGWRVPVGANGSHGLDVTATGSWYVPGDLLFAGWLGSQLLVLTDGNVTLCGLSAGQVVIFAQGEIVVQASGGSIGGDGQSLLLFSEERITVSGDGLSLRGVLLAPEVKLQGASLIYCHRAALPWLELVPEELLALKPSFALEWLETRMRR